MKDGAVLKITATLNYIFKLVVLNCSHVPGATTNDKMFIIHLSTTLQLPSGNTISWHQYLWCLCFLSNVHRHINFNSHTTHTMYSAHCSQALTSYMVCALGFLFPWSFRSPPLNVVSDNLTVMLSGVFRKGTYGEQYLTYYLFNKINEVQNVGSDILATWSLGIWWGILVIQIVVIL